MSTHEGRIGVKGYTRKTKSGKVVNVRHYHQQRDLLNEMMKALNFDRPPLSASPGSHDGQYPAGRSVPGLPATIVNRKKVARVARVAGRKRARAEQKAAAPAPHLKVLQKAGFQVEPPPPPEHPRVTEAKARLKVAGYRIKPPKPPEKGLPSKAQKSVAGKGSEKSKAPVRSPKGNAVEAKAEVLRKKVGLKSGAPDKHHPMVPTSSIDPKTMPPGWNPEERDRLKEKFTVPPSPDELSAITAMYDVAPVSVRLLKRITPGRDLNRPNPDSPDESGFHTNARYLRAFEGGTAIELDKNQLYGDQVGSWFAQYDSDYAFEQANMVHEFGHHAFENMPHELKNSFIEAAAEMVGAKPLAEEYPDPETLKPGSFPEYRDQWNALLRNARAKSQVDGSPLDEQAYKDRLRWNMFFQDYHDELAAEVSQYGAESYHEFFAEAWAEYKTNPNARRAPKLFGSLLETVMQRATTTQEDSGVPHDHAAGEGRAGAGQGTPSGIAQGQGGSAGTQQVPVGAGGPGSGTQARAQALDQPARPDPGWPQPIALPFMAPSYPTQGERDAVNDYNGEGSYPLNRRLRENHSLSGRDQTLNEQMAKLAARSTVTQDTTVYRMASQQVAPEPGEVFTDKAWVSTEHQRNYTSPDKTRETPRQSFVIDVPAGTHAIDMSHAAGWDTGEYEVVLPPGTRFQVLSKTQVGKDTEVHVRVLPEAHGGLPSASSNQISRQDLTNPDTPRTRAVSAKEFEQLRLKGKAAMAARRKEMQAPAGLDQHWDQTKADAWKSMQDEWGGMTVDAHTGLPVQDGEKKWALSMKTGHETVAIPIGSSKAEFNDAMEAARHAFGQPGGPLWVKGAHLGVFRNEDTGNLEIDPVLVVESLDQVESIGAYTHAIGGAYSFADGLGYWPPYIDERAASVRGEAGVPQGDRSVARAGEASRAGVLQSKAPAQEAQAPPEVTDVAAKQLGPGKYYVASDPQEMDSAPPPALYRTKDGTWWKLDLTGAPTGKADDQESADIIGALSDGEVSEASLAEVKAYYADNFIPMWHPPKAPTPSSEVKGRKPAGWSAAERDAITSKLRGDASEFQVPLQEFYDRFPKLAKHLHEIDAEPFKVSMGPGSPAEEGVQAVWWNPEAQGGPAIWIKPNLDKGTSVNTVGSYFSMYGEGYSMAQNTVTHELGHHLYESLSPAAKGRVVKAWMKEAGAPPQVMALPDKTAAVYGMMTFDHVTNWPTFNVSQYGATNLSEMMAEVWAEYSNNPKARPSIKAIGKVMEHEGKRWTPESGASEVVGATYGMPGAEQGLIGGGRRGARYAQRFAGAAKDAKEWLDRSSVVADVGLPSAAKKVAPEKSYHSLKGGVASTKKQANTLKRADDGRHVARQAKSNFYNETTGAPMGQTETGDTFEQLFIGIGKKLVEKRYGKFSLVAGAGSGSDRTTPLDLRTESYGGELKSISSLSPNQKTAIHAGQVQRKLEAVATEHLKPLLLVQVVDQANHKVSLYGMETFGSKAVSKMEHFGDFTYTAKDFQAAQQRAGHAQKAAGRALKGAQVTGLRSGVPVAPVPGWKPEMPVDDGELGSLWQVNNVKARFVRGKNAVSFEVDSTPEERKQVLEAADEVLRRANLPYGVKIAISKQKFTGSTGGMTSEGSTYGPEGLSRFGIKIAPWTMKPVNFKMEHKGLVSVARSQIDTTDDVKKALRVTIAHEVGHVLQGEKGDVRNGDKGHTRIENKFWKSQKDGLGFYGNSDAEEGYAEAYAQWLLKDLSDPADPMTEANNRTADAYAERYGWTKVAPQADTGLHSGMYDEQLRKVRDEQLRKQANQAVSQHGKPSNLGKSGGSGFLSAAPKDPLPHADFPKSVYDAIQPGDKIYVHPQGATIIDRVGAVTKFNKAGLKNASTSATSANLATGHGGWKRVANPKDGPISPAAAKVDSGTGTVPDPKVVIGPAEPEQKSGPAPYGKTMAPMEFLEAPLADIPKYIKDDNFLFQQKVDGIRAQLVIEPGKKPWFRSKSGGQLKSGAATKITDKILKNLGAMPAGGPTYSVDGEVLNGQWYVFDTVIQGQEKMPWEDRMAIAENWVKTINQAGVDLVNALPTARTTAEKQKLYDAVYANGGEGVMMKRRDAPYAFDKKVNTILKGKFRSTADVVVVDLGRNGHDSATLAVYDKGKLTEIGSSSLLGKQKTHQFKIGDVVEVSYLYAFPESQNIVQPTIIRHRPDKDPKSATLDQLRFVNKEVLDQQVMKDQGLKSGAPVPALSVAAKHAQHAVDFQDQRTGKVTPLKIDPEGLAVAMAAAGVKVTPDLKIRLRLRTMKGKAPEGFTQKIGPNEFRVVVEVKDKPAYEDRHLYVINNSLIHEMRHVAQHQSDPTFNADYMAEMHKKGYAQNKFEAEARQYGHLADHTGKKPLAPGAEAVGKKGWAIQPVGNTVVTPSVPPKQQSLTGGTMIDATKWTQVGGQGGSNTGGYFEDDKGNKFYVKKAADPNRASNEVLAASLYKETGVSSADQMLVKTPFSGALGTASPVIPGAKQDLNLKLRDEKYKAKLQEGFAVDAWLANWDVAGLVFDNVVSDAKGNPVRVDPGGALWYRAMATSGPKGAAFGDVVGELETFKNTANKAAAIFGNITPEQELESAKKVVAVSPERIDALVDAANFKDKSIATTMKARLKARREFIAKRYGLSLSDQRGLASRAKRDSQTSQRAMESRVERLRALVG